MKIERVLTKDEEKVAEERFYKAIMSLNDVDESVSYTHLTLPTTPYV